MRVQSSSVAWGRFTILVIMGRVPWVPKYAVYPERTHS